MRSFSLFTILLLCLAILLVDIIAFYWVQSITTLISSPLLKTTIHVLFWIFTIGLIAAIIVLKTTLDDINPRRKQLLISSLYGLTVSSFIPKIIFVIIISLLFFTRTMIPEKDSLLIVPIIGLFSGFLPFFVILNGVFKTVYKFKVYHHIINSTTLPKSFDGLRIVQISDLHLGSFNYNYSKIKKIDLKNTLVILSADHGEYLPFVKKNNQIISFESGKIQQILRKFGAKIPKKIRQKLIGFFSKSNNSIISNKISQFNLDECEKRSFTNTRKD